MTRNCSLILIALLLGVIIGLLIREHMGNDKPPKKTAAQPVGQGAKIENLYDEAEAV